MGISDGRGNNICRTPIDKPKISDTSVAQETIRGVDQRVSVSRHNNKSTATLSRYVAGKKIKVDYYSKDETSRDKSSIDTSSVSVFNDLIDKAYSKIIGLELPINDGLEFTYNEETSEWTSEGSGIMYNNILPTLGDMFIYTIDEDTTGLFIISSIRPTTIGRNTPHEISFYLKSVLSTEQLTLINKSTYKTYVFDEDTFFAGEGGLLREEEVVLRDDLLDFRNDLIFSISKYIDDDLNTILVKDGDDIYYDPYIIELYNSIVTDNFIRRRPILFLTSEIKEHYRDTIHYLLAVRGKLFNIHNSRYTISSIRFMSDSEFNSSLLDHNKISFDETSNKYYFISEEAYDYINGNTNDIDTITTDVDRVIVESLKDNVDINILKTHISESILSFPRYDDDIKIYRYIKELYIVTKYLNMINCIMR